MVAGYSTNSWLQEDLLNSGSNLKHKGEGDSRTWQNAGSTASRTIAGLRCDVLVGFKDRRARARNYRTWARARKTPGPGNAGSRTRSGEGDEDSPGNAGRAWASGEGDEEYAGLARASDEGEAGRRTRSGEGEGDSSWTTHEGEGDSSWTTQRTRSGRRTRARATPGRRRMDVLFPYP
ncbi:uncharacterized protein LOC110429563 [Sorghum bicolor]|uniref:uncharacterized protein LOC110429563 n=1 Tax=Sorghum bicolor TaxID=4558 RepID=UPI000B4254CD|nr:uncharacterized protein LOC110429563 [Sorghum bicolor]|eukprot:XP_021301321.1 uncharacterized protein LOC110429563 [Sorghum bicolor]